MLIKEGGVSALRRQVKDHLRPYALIARRLRSSKLSVHQIAWAQPRSFAQFGEDRFLLRYFDGQQSGFYVDVGAYHPFNYSNTCLLYEQGWRGINLEPSPDGLAELRRHRPRDINLPIAVAESAGNVPYSLSGSFAGIVNEDRAWGDMGEEQTSVQALPLADILREHLPPGQEIDMLDVDCEGLDLQVLRSNDWERYQPRLVLAEAHGAAARDDIDAFMADIRYRLLTQLDLTLVYERES